MSFKINELLLKSWRERWSEIEWGRSIKRLLPRGVSGDVYDLADCILRQAITGPMPNSLLMIYLNHCLNSRIVSFGAVILAITRVSNPRPQCVNCLLEFILKYKYDLYRLLNLFNLILFVDQEEIVTETKMNVWPYAGL